VSLTPAILDALLAAGASAEMIVAAVKADMVDVEARKEGKRANNAERQRRFKAKRKVTTDNAGNALPPVTPSPNDIYSNPQPASTEPNGSAEGARRRKQDPFPCPDGVEPIHWQGLIDNRKKKRAALSAGAHLLIVEKLDGWARDGWPPGPIVAHAVERGWVTVFETDEMKAANGNGHGSNRQGAPGYSGGRDKRSGFQRALDDELAEHQARRSASPRTDDHRRIAAPDAAPL